MGWSTSFIFWCSHSNFRRNVFFPPNEEFVNDFLTVLFTNNIYQLNFFINVCSTSNAVISFFSHLHCDWMDCNGCNKNYLDRQIWVLNIRRKIFHSDPVIISVSTLNLCLWKLICSAVCWHKLWGETLECEGDLFCAWLLTWSFIVPYA